MSSEEENFTCSICFDSYVFPISLSCAHIFCRYCLEKLTTNLCPLCRKQFDRKELEYVDANVEDEIIRTFGQTIYDEMCDETLKDNLHDNYLSSSLRDMDTGRGEILMPPEYMTSRPYSNPISPVRTLYSDGPYTNEVSRSNIYTTWNSSNLANPFTNLSNRSRTSSVFNNRLRSFETEYPGYYHANDERVSDESDESDELFNSPVRFEKNICNRVGKCGTVVGFGIIFFYSFVVGSLVFSLM